MESPLCRPDTRLIETFGWDETGFRRLEAHLARARASAQALGFRWDRRAIDTALAGVSGDAALRVRLTIGQAGDAEVTTAPLAPNPPRWIAGLATERLASDAPLLRHKTTERAIYDQARARLPEGLDEVIFLNERGEVCEGTITNVFVERGRTLLTPPLASGLLPGVLRAELLAAGRAQEAALTPDDLRGARVFLGNALRELIPTLVLG
ncbi:aminotransferase class IV family protein [Defluviimonas sp. WL0002]|uniref:Probable branched-chain-amino-acid aminotransferase n=1 Tax=Albidovulum marisflavi TaxID=2984159 RepID=A0ABT2ZAJ1_9RHOB|nr:aminotransferase class IV family protein [Defluviimonas sp. WL0002]MCV2868121.1 aminotransferase class IV family protein [Defluviimonas sp. WL0002]